MCNCKQRGQALRRAASSIVRGNVKSAAQSIGYVGRSLSQDVQSGALKSAAAARLNQLRKR